MTSTPSFADLGIPDALVAELTQLGIDAPFPIQAATIRDALDGRDVCGRAPTGSGKTLAFSLPTVIRVGRAEPKRPRALILTPTRELAAQIKDTLMPLAKVRRRWVQTVYGGTNVKRDIQLLNKGVDILVATPGRLKDLIDQGACSLADVQIVVLDEADRMADMGFLPEVKRLLDQTRDDRQTLLFSATLDGDVDVLIKRYQRNPARHVEEDPVHEAGDVTHHFWEVDRANRRKVATDIVRRAGTTIVFTRTKRGADRLAKQMSKDGVPTAAIHGDRNQNQRERALKQFTEGSVTTLVATDVAARGIHVDDVDLVLHYDLPGSDKDYVHRSGRTGRAGADGRVITLVFEDQAADLRAIQKAVDLPTGTDRVALDQLGGARHAPTRRSEPSPDADRSNDQPRRSGGHGRANGGQPAGGQGRASAGQDRGGQGKSGQRRKPKGGARHPSRRGRTSGGQGSNRQRRAS